MPLQRLLSLAGITRHPDGAWMKQMARNATKESWGPLERRRYVLHDRDTKFSASFRSTLILFGEPLLRRALAEFVEHFHAERNH